MLAMKQALPRFMAKLRDQNLGAVRISLSDLIWELIDRSGRWEAWLELEPGAERARSGSDEAAIAFPRCHHLNCPKIFTMIRDHPVGHAAKRQFDLYKEKLRPLINNANLYHVSERADGQRWDGMLYVDPKAGTGVLFAFRGKTEEGSHVFKLKGLDPAAR